MPELGLIGGRPAGSRSRGEYGTVRVLHVRGLSNSGAGKTLDIGSGGILFTTQERLPMGRLVEVAVNWPVRLDGACALRFVAVGKVVRSEPTKAAVQIARYSVQDSGQ